MGENSTSTRGGVFGVLLALAVVLVAIPMLAIGCFIFLAAAPDQAVQNVEDAQQRIEAEAENPEPRVDLEADNGQ